MKSWTYMIPFFLVFSALSCSKEDMRGDTINYIAYGSSFGECLGYCSEQMKVYPQQVKLTRIGWNEAGPLPEIQCALPLEAYEFSSISDSVNVGSFFALEKIYGCPDCADGGAEWVEISYDTLKHRVTFEYMNEPEELGPVVSGLRTLRESFIDCE